MEEAEQLHFESYVDDPSPEMIKVDTPEKIETIVKPSPKIRKPKKNVEEIK